MAKKLNNITEQRLSVRGNAVVSPLSLTESVSIKETQLEAPSIAPGKDNNSTTPNTPIPPSTLPVPTFGVKSRNITTYPNDVVRLDLYNAVDVYLGTNYRVDDFI